MSNPSFLRVLGAIKTGTSTMVAMLNDCPSVFVLYETHMHYDGIGKYGQRLIERYPEAAPLFTLSMKAPEQYRLLQAVLEAKTGRGYDFIGDKTPGMRFDLLDEDDADQTIFCTRDVRSWLSKRAVQDKFKTGRDLVPAACEFTEFLVRSHLLRKVLHVRLEDVLADHRRVRMEVCDFLGVPAPEQDDWWNRIATRDEDDPKSAINWWRSHPSSLFEPVKEDTTYELRPHPFWDAILPLFDRYYSARHGAFEAAEIERALTELAHIGERFSASHADTYASVSTETFGAKAPRVKRVERPEGSLYSVDGSD